MVGLHEPNTNTAPDAVEDLVLLQKNDLSENGIVKNLRNRYKDNSIYTYIGPVLLSVNPFQTIRGLYTEELMQEYYGRYKFEVAPHVFASAEDAHRKLMGTGVNQCVIISGESGAGKTEAAKKVMEYVSKVSADTTEANNKSNRTVAEIKDSLLKSNPVLEAFGNAKTLRNDNSSRFGKYMEIQMDYNGTPLGGRISNYLLEKPRVVHQTKGERNFHIFYLLTNGMASKNPMYSQLKLSKSDSFSFCCDPSSSKVKTVNDQEWFEEMDEAMQKVGIDQATKMEMYNIVAAVLWLGNIMFELSKKGTQDACRVANKDACQQSAKLLKVSNEELEAALTTRSRETTIDKVKSPLTTVDECEKVRDALAKALYSRMFQCLVEKINETIFTEKKELSLGVLDIYGFEIFEHNSFEQLCINYCNEKLQQYFIQLTLKAEQDEYESEGIEWKDIDYFNNQIVCDLIESKRPAGVIAFLDEEITLGRGTDMTFLNKMNQQLKSHPHYAIPPSSKSSPEEFVIRHYAGDVKYSAEGMIDKNKDTLFRDLLVLTGYYSKSQFVQSMFPEGREKHDFKKPITAGSQFISDMKDLITTLEKCEPHYIRCIKPNDDKRSGYFNDERVLHQVKYLGLLENVRVRRAGYAYRREYPLFVRRYKMLSKKTWPTTKGNDRQNTETILNEVGITKSEYKFGKTKIFIESPQSLFRLEKEREKAMVWVVGVIQHAYRQWKLRLYFQKIRELAVNLLHNKKRRNNSWVLYFLGDYVEATKNEQIMQQVREFNDGKIVFADVVDIHYLGKKRTVARETLIITKKSVLFMKKKGGNAASFQRISFDQLESVAYSKFADNFIAFNLKAVPHPKGKPPMLQPSILVESVRKSEIATVLDEEFKTSYGKPAPLKFADEQKIVVVQKKPGLGAMFKKPMPVVHTLEFFEDSSLQGRRAELVPQPPKKDPAYDPTVNRIAVSKKLGGQAELQLNSELPDRVIAHTAVGRQGKKVKQNRRRGY